MGRKRRAAASRCDDNTYAPTDDIPGQRYKSTEERTLPHCMTGQLSRSPLERRPGEGYSLKVNVDRQNEYPLAVMSERRQLKHQMASTT